MAIGIYSITSPSGKKYVGMTKSGFDQRWKQHRKMLKAGNHPTPALQLAYAKYGEEMLNFEVLEVMDESSSVSDVFLREVFWWELLNANGVFLYNSRPTSSGGRSPSAETRKKMSLAHSKEKVAIACANCSKMFFPKKKRIKFCSKSCARRSVISRASVSEETRAKTSNSMQGNSNAVGNTGGKLAMHNRWHVARGIVNPDCSICSPLHSDGS